MQVHAIKMEGPPLTDMLARGGLLFRPPMSDAKRKCFANAAYNELSVRKPPPPHTNDDNQQRE